MLHCKTTRKIYHDHTLTLDLNYIQSGGQRRNEKEKKRFSQLCNHFSYVGRLRKCIADSAQECVLLTSRGRSFLPYNRSCICLSLYLHRKVKEYHPESNGLNPTKPLNINIKFVACFEGLF